MSEKRIFTICCPNCLNTVLERDEEHLIQTGEDKFICPECGEVFKLEHCQYI